MNWAEFCFSLKDRMILGIDASNIRGGGGVTHLKELLEHAEAPKFGFDSVIVWSGKKTLVQIADRSWLKKIDVPELNKSLFHRVYWQKFKLSQEAEKYNCDLLFIPGGSFSGNFKNIVSMSQNLLPFDWTEMKRYGFSVDLLRLILLRYSQTKTFQKSKGVIFLTNHARDVVLAQANIDFRKTVVVNHGINKKFFHSPKVQKKLNQFNEKNPFRILYVSFIGIYKHQWNVVEAFHTLKVKGLPIELTLVGDPTEKKAMKKLESSLLNAQEYRDKIHHVYGIPYEKIQQLYIDSDIFLFASTCETYGQIVTEAMASGLPIISSNHSTMKELLGPDCYYFDPENPAQISSILEKALSDVQNRTYLAKQNYNMAKKLTWEKCAQETFSFFQKMTM